MSVEELQQELGIAKRQVVTDGYEMSLGEIASLYKNSELIIAPAYQRLIRWDESQKTRFIESILLGIPVPPIFVFQREDGIWELIDGLQRISTVLHLMGVLQTDGAVSAPLVLEGTNYLPSLAGMKWAGLEGDASVFNIPLQLEIKRARMRVEILRKESDQDTKYELFQRLNTGGSKLSEQEVRNSVMVMLNFEFFEWIRLIANIDKFRNSIQLTDAQIEIAQDHEMALRFVAYRHFPYSRGLDVNEYLDLAARNLSHMTSEQREVEREVFEWTFDLLWMAFNGDAFRRWDGTRHLGRSLLSAFDVITFGVSSNRANISLMTDEARVAWIKFKVRAMWSAQDFLTYSAPGVRGTTRLTHLLPFAQQYFAT